jgi:hypothetical protein
VGPAWRARFERALEQAESVWITGADAAPGALDIELAAEAAMGAAVMKAESLLTEAVQLLVLGPAGEIEAGVSGGAVRRLWGRRPQRLLRAPRGAGQRARAAAPPPGAALAAILRIEGAAAALAHAAPEAPPRLATWNGDGMLDLAYDRVVDAAAAALQLLDRSGEAIRIGLDYGLVQMSEHGRPSVGGAAARMAARIAASSTPGCAQASAAFAAALHLGEASPASAEYMGDLSGSGPDNPVGVYALVRARS